MHWLGWVVLALAFIEGGWLSMVVDFPERVRCTINPCRLWMIVNIPILSPPQFSLASKSTLY